MIIGYSPCSETYDHLKKIKYTIIIIRFSTSTNNISTYQHIIYLNRYRISLPQLWFFRVFINLKSTPYSPLWLLRVPGVTGCLKPCYPVSAAPNDEAFLIHDEGASRKRSSAALRVLRARSGQRRLGVRQARQKTHFRTIQFFEIIYQGRCW